MWKIVFGKLFDCLQYLQVLPTHRHTHVIRYGPAIYPRRSGRHDNPDNPEAPFLPSGPLRKGKPCEQTVQADTHANCHDDKRRATDYLQHPVVAAGNDSH